MSTFLDLGSAQILDLGSVQSGTSPSTPLTQTASDSITFSDAVVVTPGVSPALNLSVVDSFSFSDSPILFLTLAFAFSDSITFSDNVVEGGGVINVSVSDVITFVEDESIDTSVGDTLTFNDNIMNILVGAFAVITDSFELDDSISIVLTDGAGTLLLSIRDNLTFSDAVVAFGDCPIKLSDILVFSDVFSLFGTEVLAFSDSLIFLDVPNISTPLLIEKLNLGPEAISFSDFVNLHLLMSADSESFSDTLSLTDSVNIGLNLPLAINDTLVFSDSYSALGSLSISLAEMLTLTDSETVIGTVGGLSVSDILTFSDSVNLSRLGIYGIAIADVLSFSDTAIVLPVGSPTIAISDSLTFSDAVTLSQLPSIIVSDSFAFSDGVSISMTKLFNNYYLRRYLNDVTGIVPINIAPADSLDFEDSIAHG